MGSFGERLRREREMRGISLEEIVATTKIGRRLLLALEEEQFDLLPGGIFNKAYVRAYAKCVGINEDEAVAEYLEAAQEPAPDTRVIAQQHASIYADQPARSGFPLLPVFILLVVAVAGVGGYQLYRQHQREREQKAANNVSEQATNSTSGSAEASANRTPTVSPSSAPSAPPATSPPVANVSRVAAGSTGATGGAFEVTIRPKDRAWVSVKADGKYVVRGILKAPDVKTIHATNEVVFYTGNAGEVALAFNGKTVPLSGGANQEQTVVFDPHGVTTRPASQ